MNVRFPIGLQFQRYSVKTPRIETITDVLTTINNTGEVVRIEYVTEYEFMGQTIKATALDSTIARSLGNDGLAPYRNTLNPSPISELIESAKEWSDTYAEERLQKAIKHYI